MELIIKNTDFTDIARSVKVDGRRRVVLPSALVQEDITFHVYANSDGQIILDPQVTIPASEAWLFKNREALALVRQGLADVAQGKVSRIDIETL